MSDSKSGVEIDNTEDKRQQEDRRGADRRGVERRSGQKRRIRKIPISGEDRRDKVVERRKDERRDDENVVQLNPPSSRSID